MLWKLKSQSVIYALQEFNPVKYFSIDRVFRNETLDATHLAEFHQIEGLVADHNLTLGDLMGMLYEFFSKMGNGSIMCAYMCTYLKATQVHNVNFIGTWSLIQDPTLATSL